MLLVLVSALESLAAPLISTVTFVASTQLLGVKFTQPYALLAIFSALLCYALVRPEAIQHERPFLSGWTIATRVGIAWIAVVALLLMIGYATKVSEIYSRRALFLWFVLTAPLLMGTPVLLRQWFRRIAVVSGNARSTVVAGVNRVSRELATVIDAKPELGLQHNGFFDDRCPQRLGTVDSRELVGTFRDLRDVAKSRRIDVVFVGLPYHLERTKKLLNNLQDTTASVYLIPDISFVDLIQARADDISGIPIIALCETPFQGWPGFKKRATDVSLASLMLLAALPLIIAIACAIKLTTRGSVIFKQRRYGLDGDEIIVYKFRTTTAAEDDDSMHQGTDALHVTALGGVLRRYSLDELPQLVNVVQGRMSLVGPRPHAITPNEEYRKLIPGYMVRHKVAPGITGLAQVNGCRGETADLEEMKRGIDYDLDYLRHWSLMLDLKILLKTWVTVFRSQKAAWR